MRRGYAQVLERRLDYINTCMDSEPSLDIDGPA